MSNFQTQAIPSCKRCDTADYFMSRFWGFCKLLISQRLKAKWHFSASMTAKSGAQTALESICHSQPPCSLKSFCQLQQKSKNKKKTKKQQKN